ncbi:hypothetical protein AU255_18295 [Methyloprofundus sedimenti]|uniref:Uncharacterized protein n=1 Tax=Methyloprofundus sedimenti TaxID=1420851 RepID=A0A1V8M1H8_9GAMM|nr:hypothetical protein [Methyloprofundus sedimenti]OQK15420.1 hypothetical protein AU255_18295 [Methyloprofundus sedimenti]
MFLFFQIFKRLPTFSYPELRLLSQFFNKENKKPSKEELFFKDVINNMRDPNSIKWSYKNHHNLDMSGIPLYETWEKWLKDLINHMDVQNIDYPNFGDHYYFYEMTSGKEINIPIGVEDTRNKKVRDSFKNGMVLRLMPRET